MQGAPLTDRHGPAVPIIQHEDVRRMLMNLKAGSEAMRVFMAYLMLHSDVAKHDPDEGVRLTAQARVDILTPLVKAYPSGFGLRAHP